MYTKGNVLIICGDSFPDKKTFLQENAFWIRKLWYMQACQKVASRLEKFSQIHNYKSLVEKLGKITLHT